jgi:hypothetical protein
MTGAGENSTSTSTTFRAIPYLLVMTSECVIFPGAERQSPTAWPIDSERLRTYTVSRLAFLRTPMG